MGGVGLHASQLLDLGSRMAVGSALARHKRAGVIRQLARGLYDYPIEHSKLGRVAPQADAVARAIARRDAVRLQPTGAYAANVLGLSEQVPTKIVFLTDGPPRRVTLGRREIVLKRTTPATWPALAARAEPCFRRTAIWASAT